MSDDEPQPNRRTALRHALGGLALLGCMAWNLYLLERAGWTDFGQQWSKAQGRLYGPAAMRERVKLGMTRAEVEGRIACGREGQQWFIRCIPEKTLSVEYPEYGFQVVYRGSDFSDFGSWKVTDVSDLP